MILISFNKACYAMHRFWLQQHHDLFHRNKNNTEEFQASLDQISEKT